ncbi:MAG TPA: hypothetical protein DCQ51_01695 [Planktothrix sp. UBA8407]|jgi:hypothetical protein|nr:hypothetical protein [Planktothrix sp. UBA8402]HAO09912.1 hypothetical protein [Planktothrix sp. UBA8407]HBK22739.1 hypothetical protein [Planktothrix sp. UBA10369]
MTCPRDKHGKLCCEIIDHPDRNESFCNFCKDRFVKKGKWDFDEVWAVIFVLGLFFLILMLSGCKKPVNSELIRTMDMSNSGLNHPKSFK